MDKYTPLELEKMSRRGTPPRTAPHRANRSLFLRLLDPVKVFARNVAVNKTIAGRSVSKMEKNKMSPYSYKNYAPVLKQVEEPVVE